MNTTSIAATLSVKKLSNLEFEMLLEHDQAIEAPNAQAAIYESAVQVCNGKKPKFGKYEFESKEPISNKKAKSTFYFKQVFTCSNEVYAATKAATKNEKSNLSSAQVDSIKAKAREFTNKFLSAKRRGNYREAYELLTPGMKSTSNYVDWEKKEADYRDLSGEFASRNIWRITIYDNPENSPKPGIYIAADYESEFNNIPVHCGYVIWYLHTPESKDFKVMREEYGYIENKIYREISDQDLKITKSKFGCNPN